MAFRYWNPQQVTGSAFNPSNSGQGGNGNWNTTSILWSTNGDGTGGTAWTNSTTHTADIGTAILTLQTNITTGDIQNFYGSVNGAYALTIASGITNAGIVFNVPVTSSTDTTYGLQAVTNITSLNFKEGLYCYGFHFGGPTIISGSLDATLSSILNKTSDLLTLNCNSNIDGAFTIYSGGGLTANSTYTASFNDYFDTDQCNIQSDGLIKINGLVTLYGQPTFKGTGITEIYGNMIGDYNLIKNDSGILFLSGTKSSANTRDIKINQGTLKIKPDTLFESSNFVCSGTLNLMGNTSIFGNVTFATGTLRLGI